MRLKQLLSSILLSIGLIFFAGYLSAGESGKQAVNPHWTGKYCEECHIDKNPQQKNAPLKFANDPIKLCNRCHTRAFVTVEIHPIDVAVDKDMERIFPARWPLNNGKLSCLTCHDALLQMYDNFPVKWMNPNFLRGGPYRKKTDFCFACHPREKFQKANPHKQLDQQGKVIEQSCLVCHNTAPDPKQTRDSSAVSFKQPPDSLCVGCHPVHFASHGADRGQLKVSSDMQTALEEQERALHLDLPLNNGRMFCGTCHNPHEKGVIRRPEAQRGAGEKYFLRMKGGYELCVICHTGKQVSDRQQQVQLVRETLKTPPGVMVSHKPFLENKCKACHEVTAQHLEKPEAIYLCFRQGCHKPEILEKPYLHNKSVVGDCYACHVSHASGYGKLLRVNEETQCRACHPLIRDKKNKELPKTEREISDKEHRTFAAYLRTSPVPAGNDCGFCHNLRHRVNRGSMDLGACSDCHVYVKEMLLGDAFRSLNVHQKFKEKPCSKCHDPHAAAHKYQLKQPPKTYTR